MISSLTKVVEQYPVLQKPAYVVYNGALTLKNMGMRVALKNFGHIPKRLSDRGQDRWVIDEVFKGKRDGFFVELGAADGFSDSNTFVLEKHFGWSGLLIEPNPLNYKKIQDTYGRTSTRVPLAVDPEPGQLEFVLDGQRSGLIMEGTDNAKAHRSSSVEEMRKNGQIKVVETVPLEEVFDRYKAPSTIDYFSLDVEGSETRILRNFPFDRYKFLAMTIERPTPELNEILFANGYVFVRNSLYDTFYVHESVPGFDDIPKEPFEQLPAKAW